MQCKKETEELRNQTNCGWCSDVTVKCVDLFVCDIYSYTTELTRSYRACVVVQDLHEMYSYLFSLLTVQFPVCAGKGNVDNEDD